MNNEPDYKDNLAFEPEMTWEQLVREYTKYTSPEVVNSFSKGRVEYYKSGYVYLETNKGRVLIKGNRTPRQMKLIIEGLM